MTRKRKRKTIRKRTSRERRLNPFTVPETIHIPNGEPTIVIKEGKQKIVQPYTSVKKMLEGIVFEETYDNAMNVKPEPEP